MPEQMQGLDLGLFYGDAPPFILFAVLIAILTLVMGIMPGVFNFHANKVNGFIDDWVDERRKKKAKRALAKLLEPQSGKVERHFRNVLLYAKWCLIFLAARIVCCKFLCQFQDQPVSLYINYSIIGLDALTYFGLGVTVLYLIKLYKLFVAASASLRKR